MDLLLFNVGSRIPYYLEPNDTLVVPFRQYFVTVSGAVVNLGRYPYIPDRNWECYIALAGGFRKEQNTSKKVTVWGAVGQKMNKNSIIIPLHDLQARAGLADNQPACQARPSSFTPPPYTVVA